MKENNNSPYAIEYDLTNCDKEPVHLIRYVQPHALLIACHPDDWNIKFISNNCSTFLGKSASEYLNKDLRIFLPADIVAQILRKIKTADSFSENGPIPFPGFYNGETYNLIPHINDTGLLVLEIEPQSDNVRSIDFQMKMGAAISRLQSESRLSKVFELAAIEVKKVTGFDRVMVYKFDEEGHGTVIAEALNEGLEPYLGLRYPASDIPQQARDLFIKNQVRFISDLRAEPAILRPLLHEETGKPFDQTYCAARGTSPIHVEYLLNMGVRGSMTIAILKQGKLWGLFACHHRDKIWLDYSVRYLIKFMGQVISGHLVINSALQYKDDLLDVQITKNRLLEQMNTEWDVTIGLTQGDAVFTDLIECAGGAIYNEKNIVKIGDCPDNHILKLIAKKIDATHENLVWESNHLIEDLPELEGQLGETAGALILTISEEHSRQYLMWFRNEKKHTVNWGGNPDKSVVKKEKGQRLSPRKSFEKWVQEVGNQSEKWKSGEINIAIDLRSDIKEFFLKKYKELQIANENLLMAYDELDSFSYTVAHDLRAPLRSIRGFSQILLEDYEERLDDYGKNVIDVILKNTDKINLYINEILKMARLGRQRLSLQELDMNKLINVCYQDMILVEKLTYLNRKIKFSIESEIPPMLVDPVSIKQVFENIIGNAIKYTRSKEEAEIKISYKLVNSFHEIRIVDNGIGFEDDYKDKVFEIFSRLTTDKNFEGTGVGMAIAKKIIKKHNGSLDCFSKEGEGATFIVNLPINMRGGHND